MKRETAEEGKEVKVEFLPLDLSSFQSTTDFVCAFKEKNLPLHILINNAAVYGLQYSKNCGYTVLARCYLINVRKIQNFNSRTGTTDDGLETHFQACRI